MVFSSENRYGFETLLSLAVSSPNVLEGLMQELTNLTDALINRDYDNAGLIYDHHFSRIRMLTAPLRTHTPQYFTEPVLPCAASASPQSSDLSS